MSGPVTRTIAAVVKLRGRLLSAGGILLGIAWFLGAVTIATEVLGVEARRSNLWIVMLIFISPVPVIFFAEELMHRIKHGPSKPGRHTRT